jgi:hypothetical protein
MLAIYEAEDIDSAFWFTFAGFEQPRRRLRPRPAMTAGRPPPA